MKNKIIRAALLTALISNYAYTDETYDLNETYYTYDTSYEYNAYPYQEEEPSQERPGNCYYSARHIACYTTGLVLGAAMIAGIIAIVVHENHCAHSH